VENRFSCHRLVQKWIKHSDVIYAKRSINHGVSYGSREIMKPIINMWGHRSQ
jgi:hypothetical protein